MPKSQFSEYDTGDGRGQFKSILNKRYVTFDYKARLSHENFAAHGIFTWDDKSKIYRYWWFEDSGHFMQATCHFINKNTLCFNWHNSLLVQTYQLLDDGNIKLEMRYPDNEAEYKTILKVLFTKIK